MDDNPLTFIIHDKHGAIYKLGAHEDEDSFRSYLISIDGLAGRLNILYESPEEWIIADLQLFAETPSMVSKWYLRLLRDMNLWKPPAIDYRNRGLGTALLAFVEERARQRQVQRVTGYVVRRDYEEWQGLLQWYSKRGYTVIPTSAIDRTGSGTDKVADISKDL